MENFKNIQETDKNIPLQIVKSRTIAECLCVDYGFFKQLINIHVDKFNPKRKVWVFRCNDDFSTAFKLLTKEANDRYAAKKSNNERNK